MSETDYSSLEQLKMPCKLHLVNPLALEKIPFQKVLTLEINNQRSNAIQLNKP